VAEAGCSLVFFPEGTFTRMPGLLPFHVGVFAAQAGVPMVPVIIRGTRSLLRAESWFPRRVVVKIHVGAPIVLAGREWTAAVKLCDAVRDAMLQQPGEPDLEQKAPPI
jgi:1-acyl-sn-glycerol-3-phosphate acyltransferase